LTAALLTPAALATMLAALPGPAAAQQAPACQFVLGFKTLHDLVPADSGDCTENQYFDANGDAQQHTTKGLMVWRKADNTTAFTNGVHTWLIGPTGLADRANSDRFSWEAAAPSATPTPAAAPSATPQPSAAPAPVYPWFFKKVTEAPVLCGQSVPCMDSAPNAGTQYAGGHVIKKDGTLASGMIVKGKVGNMDPISNTTGDDGLFNILIATNCPQGPIGVDVYIVDGGGRLSSYINHITYNNCQQAGEFHFDFMEVG
jgi:hypothetical protein